MTATLGLASGRRAPLAGEELRRQMLALVLAFVLTWYTLVVPAGAGARSPRRFEPEDDGHDGEVRGVKAAAPAAKTGSRADDGEDLDWPEYIYP
jgi:hypothetical protein